MLMGSSVQAVLWLVGSGWRCWWIKESASNAALISGIKYQDIGIEWMNDWIEWMNGWMNVGVDEMHQKIDN